MDLVLEKLREFGADFKITKKYIEVIPPQKIRSAGKVEARFSTEVRPMSKRLSVFWRHKRRGERTIYDTLSEGRLNYVQGIKKMGAKTKIIDAHQMLVEGPTKLKGRTINSYDLRAGASLIIAALVASGKTVIKDIYQVDRGYERIEERLQKLGADIKN